MSRPLYATVEQLNLRALPFDVLQQASVAQKEDALMGASGMMDSYLAAGGYVTPLASFDNDIIEACVSLAAWRIAIVVGLVQELGEGSSLYIRQRNAMAWLEAIASGKLALIGYESAGASGARPVVRSRPKRGWDR